MQTHLLEIQIASHATQIPSLQQFQLWVDTTLTDLLTIMEVVIRIVDEAEMIELNQTYRHKMGTTNILSFPFESPEGLDLNLLGDLVICAPVIEQEATVQQKQPTDHWAHIVIHGLLHLLGYDHIDDTEAEMMESLEIRILKQLNINNPYQEH